MNFRSLFSLFSSDLAIDLGTANTLVYARGKGIVVDEPSIVAINKLNGDIEAVGREAKEMLGRTPGNIVAIRPLKDGVIADFKVTEKMLNYFITRAHNRKMFVHPRIVIGVPAEITQVEKRAVELQVPSTRTRRLAFHFSVSWSTASAVCRQTTTSVPPKTTSRTCCSASSAREAKPSEKRNASRTSVATIPRVATA